MMKSWRSHFLTYERLPNLKKFPVYRISGVQYFCQRLIFKIISTIVSSTQSQKPLFIEVGWLTEMYVQPRKTLIDYIVQETKKDSAAH